MSLCTCIVFYLLQERMSSGHKSVNSIFNEKPHSPVKKGKWMVVEASVLLYLRQAEFLFIGFISLFCISDTAFRR